MEALLFPITILSHSLRSYYDRSSFRDIIKNNSSLKFTRVLQITRGYAHIAYSFREWLLGYNTINLNLKLLWLICQRLVGLWHGTLA